MSLLRRWWPVLVLAAAPLLPLWPAVFGGQAIGPWDQIRAMWPWNGPIPKAPWDVLQADAVLQFAPWRYLVFQSWSRGEMPFWNPYQLMGTPLLANSQSAGFYPPHILIGLLHVPLYPAMTFLAWFHLFWAGLGVYMLCRRLGALRVGAVVGGVSFSLSAFMVAWTSLPSVITTVAWIPWVLACTLAVFQTNLFWRIDQAPSSFEPTTATAAEAVAEAMSQQRAGFRWRAGLAVSIGMMLLAGHLQFAAFGLLALVLFTLALLVRTKTISEHVSGFRMEMKRDGTSVGRPIAGKQAARLLVIFTLWPSLVAALLGFCLAAPQLLPVLNFSRHSHRQTHASSSGYDEYVRGAISPIQLGGVVFPTVLGHPEQPSNVLEGVNSYWPAFVKLGADFAESAIGIGPLLLACMFLLRLKDWRQPEVAGVAGIGVLGLLIALGTPFDRLLYFGVPGWAATGSPGRAGVLFVLSACVLGGLGASALVKEGLSQRRWRYPLLALILGGLTITIPAYLRSGLNPAALKQMSDAMVFALPAILAAIALTAFVIFLPLTGRRRGIALSVLTVLLGVILVNGVFPISFGTPLAKPGLDGAKRYAFVNNDWQLFFRVHAIMPPNMATLFGFHDVAGYDSLLDRDTKAALDSVNHADSSPRANGNMIFIKPSFDAKALAGLGISEVWSQTPALPGMAPPRELQAIAIPGPGRITSPQGDAKILDEGSDHIVLAATGPGTLILRDRNSEGWSAEVDHAEAAIRPGFFRQVELPAGAHTVKFTYSPPGLSLGIKLLILSLVGLLLQLSGGLRRPSKPG